MKTDLTRIGIRDNSFQLTSVKKLVKEGVLERPLDGNHGEIHPKGDDFVADGIPFIMASDIRNNRVDLTGCKFIREEQANSLRKGFARNGDILLTHKATIGETAIVKFLSLPYVMLTPQVTYYRILDEDVCIPEYLLYYFKSSYFQQILALWSGGGATRSYIGVTAQQKLPVILPPLAKQRKIAGVLSAYDDAIENNRRRIAILENMAEEIYREWFVRMRFPGHQNAKFEKGVPEGWEVKPFDAVVSIKPTEHVVHGEEYTFVSMDELSCNSFYFDCDEKRLHPSGSRFRNGDVLFPRITPSVENGKRGFVTCLAEGRIGVGSTEFIVMREKEICKEHLFFVSCSDAFRTHAEQSMVGASGRQRVHEKCFSSFLVKTPPNGVRKQFVKAVSPFFLSIVSLSRQNSLLERKRNSLLPRLISGKLPVDELDIQLPPSMTDDAAEEASEEPVHA